jgi:precorrin-8X/cobalt-precorrin-8 methylmutase
VNDHDSQSHSQLEEGDTMPSPRAVSAIELRSFEILQQQVDLSHLPPLSAEVVARVVHATADPEYATSMRLTESAVERALIAIQAGVPLITDVSMVSSGITARTAVSALAAFAAAKTGPTRSYATMAEAVRHYGMHAIYIVGCSPTSLEALLDVALDGSPELIIATPVGYVGAAEAKERLRGTEHWSISNEGPKGGSAVAASITNALIYLAQGERRLTIKRGE